MIRSYRLFMGRNMTKNIALYIGICFVITAAVGVTAKISDSEIFNALTKNFLPLFSVVMAPAFCAGTLVNVYSANWKNSAMGYKFYHSLPDAAGQFRKAIITANIVVAAVVLCFSMLFAALFTFKLAIFSIALSMFIISIINFLGHIKNVWSVLVPLMLLGFFAGFFSGPVYDDVPDTAAMIVMAASAALFIGSVVFSAAKAGSAWVKEIEKCKD